MCTGTANPHHLPALHSWNIPWTVQLQSAKLKPYETNGVRGPKDTQNMVCKLIRNKNNICVEVFLNDMCSLMEVLE
jgi:hypothetical protein